MVLDRERTIEETQAHKDPLTSELMDSTSENHIYAAVPQYKIDRNGILYRELPDGHISKPLEEFPEGFLARSTTQERVAERLRRQKDPYWYEKQRGLPEPVALPKPLVIRNDRSAHIKTNARRRFSFT